MAQGGCIMTGAEIKAARATLGLTQSQFAVVMGYNNNKYVSNLEADRVNMSVQGSYLLQAYLDGYRPKHWPQTCA